MTARPSLFKVFVAALLTATDPTHPPLMMWAASGQARLGGRWLSVPDIGSRLAIVTGIEAASRFNTLRCSADKPAHPAFIGHYHCALRLNQSSKVLAPAALARYLRRCANAYGFLRYNRVSACFAALTPDCFTLRKPNARQVVAQRLMAPHCTLNAFNRLVLHSRSLQAQCFAALRQGLSAGCAYPKSCTMPLARQAHHRPLNTSPHRHYHKIKAQAS